MRAGLFLFFIVLTFGYYAGSSGPATAGELQPLEKFARKASFELVELSPDGSKIAYLQNSEHGSNVVVKETEGKALRLVSIGDVKPRSVIWVGNDNLVIVVSITESDGRLRAGHRKKEYLRAFGYDIKSDKMVGLLRRNEKDLSPIAVNLGSIIAVDHENKNVYMPVLGSSFKLLLMKVNVKTGRGKIDLIGNFGESGWVMNANNEIVARTIQKRRDKEYRIEVKDGKKWRVIFESQNVDPQYGVIGLNPQGTALLVSDNDKKAAFSKLREIDLVTGEISEPVFEVDGYDTGGAVVDPFTRQAIGAAWTADHDEYYWFDKELGMLQASLKQALKGHAVRLTSWSRDRSKFIVEFAKPGQPVKYGLLNPATNQLKVIASSRPALKANQLGPVSAIRYKARDGLEIHAFLTLPPGGKTKNLPLVVFPHGGPQARDSSNFDWISQMIASRGYAVLQPNFRGSSGYGSAFVRAGHGEWGKAMQDDVTDGVKKLVADGIADPGKVCIGGASYGGYAALAGGAFTPDLYQCVIAIAPVSDLLEMYKWSGGENGKGAKEYWAKFMTNSDKHPNYDMMKEGSPARFASQFKAPVMLIHGFDDTVVPIRESERMEKALIKEGKPVTFIKQKGGDHWLSFEETRLDTAREMLAFLDQHLSSPE